MKNNAGGSRIRQFLAMMAAAALMLMIFTLPASAQDNSWQNLIIKLSWANLMDGTSGSVQAVPVTWSEEQHAFWAYVSSDAPMDELTLEVSMPDRDDITFTPGTGSVIAVPDDAEGSLDAADANIIIAMSSDDSLVDFYYLYVSTTVSEPVPHETPAPTAAPTPEPTPVQEISVTPASHSVAIQTHSPSNNPDVIGYVTTQYLRSDGVVLV